MAHAPRESSGDAGAEFVRHIVSDPKNVPDVMLLNGYLGASSEEAHERPYLSPDLSNYVEIPRSAILYQATLPKEQDAHGGVIVWVRRDAALQYRMAPTAQALGELFRRGDRRRRGGATNRSRRHDAPMSAHSGRRHGPQCVPHHAKSLLLRLAA
jgi:hypothetical protein